MQASSRIYYHNSQPTSRSLYIERNFRLSFKMPESLNFRLFFKNKTTNIRITLFSWHKNLDSHFYRKNKEKKIQEGTLS